MNNLTERQKREIEYHKEHAALLQTTRHPVNFDIVTSPKRRWWNAYWSVWTFLRDIPLQERKVLVVGCGAGDDALIFAELGATVSAFDLSLEMLALAVRKAKESGLTISFEQMPAEKMTYRSGTFDLVFARDILHHVDIPATMDEIVRVSKPGAIFVVDEIYSHSITDVIRRSWIVERLLYLKMKGFIYNGSKPYITQDERKMSEGDIAQVSSRLSSVQCKKFYNMVVTRLIPDTFTPTAKLDRIALTILGSIGRFVAGRIVLVGTLRKV